MPCYCGNSQDFANCCGKFISGAASAPTPEALMRSRFSAYCVKDYGYIWRTYGKHQRPSLSEASLAHSASNTVWLGLEVIASSSQGNGGSVEFAAIYKEGNSVFRMHEISQFEYQDGAWVYTTGAMQSDSGNIKLSRNAPCPCSSGKKFKQCCINKVH